MCISENWAINTVPTITTVVYYLTYKNFIYSFKHKFMYYLFEHRGTFLVRTEQEFKQHWSNNSVVLVKTSFDKEELEILSTKLLVL